MASYSPQHPRMLEHYTLISAAKRRAARTHASLPTGHLTGCGSDARRPPRCLRADEARLTPPSTITAGGVDEITFKKRLRWRLVGAALRAFTDRGDLNWHQRLVNIVAPESTPMSKHRDWCPARLEAAGTLTLRAIADGLGPFYRRP
jgi:hypothetical protein